LDTATDTSLEVEIPLVAAGS